MVFFSSCAVCPAILCTKPHATVRFAVALNGALLQKGVPKRGVNFFVVLLNMCGPKRQFCFVILVLYLCLVGVNVYGTHSWKLMISGLMCGSVFNVLFCISMLNLLRF